MSSLAELWSRARATSESFSLRLFNKHGFDFHLSPRWPADKIRKALSLNNSGRQNGFAVYGLTTDEFDFRPHLPHYARDVHGRMALTAEGDVHAFYDSTNLHLRVYDFTHKRAAFVYDTAHQFTEWEMHSPFKEFFHLWALKNDGILIHSGIVSNGTNAVLLPGAGGSGKSTTVLSCLQHGLSTTGDDYNLLLQTDAGFIATPLYGNIKLKNGNPYRFPMMHDWQSETLSYAAKTIYYPPENATVWEQATPSLTGILCPQIGSEKPAITAMEAPKLINQLALSSIIQSPFLAKEYLSRAVRLSSGARRGKLLLSPDLAQNAATLREWLAA